MKLTGQHPTSNWHAAQEPYALRFRQSKKLISNSSLENIVGNLKHVNRALLD